MKEITKKFMECYIDLLKKFHRGILSEKYFDSLCGSHTDKFDNLFLKIHYLSDLLFPLGGMVMGELYLGTAGQTLTPG